jgi:hypothetical protein
LFSEIADRGGVETKTFAALFLSEGKQIKDVVIEVLAQFENPSLLCYSVLLNIKLDHPTTAALFFVDQL